MDGDGIWGRDMELEKVEGLVDRYLKWVLRGGR